MKGDARRPVKDTSNKFNKRGTGPGMATEKINSQKTNGNKMRSQDNHDITASLAMILIDSEFYITVFFE